VLQKHNIPVILTAHDYKLVCPSYHLQADCPKNIFAHAWHCFINKKHKDSYAASLVVAWEWLIHKLGRVYERNIDMVVAPSKFVAEKLVAYGWPEDKVKVVPNFSDLPVLTEEKPPGHYVLFVGRLSPEKGHDVLIQTAQALPHVPFIVVGEYEDQNTPILPNVQYVGFRTGIELTEIYRQARALFVPSLAQETFGLNVIEAALQKVPAIVSNRGALPEIVINGGTGYVFDIERMHAAVEYITELWSNPDVGDYLGRAAQAQAIAKFTPEAVWPQLYDLYCSFHTK
ncbi:MAG TPA: glycosyltransferase family 4 protein, partial [Flavobacterium sp.]|nr:glycosyltransferase family 4 protein [Flavobacterium sp.]